MLDVFHPHVSSIPLPVPLSIPMSILPLDGIITDQVNDFRGNKLLVPVMPLFAATRTGGGCIVNGPFKDLRVRLGPSNSTRDNERCLNRDFAPGFVEALGLPEVLKQSRATDSYENFTSTIELAHGVGHGGTGGLIGQMTNLFSSPNGKSNPPTLTLGSSFPFHRPHI